MRVVHACPGPISAKLVGGMMIDFYIEHFDVSKQDHLSRFIFENAPIRGEFVRLENTWQTVLDRHEYPPILRKLLGELMAAAALLSATLKFNGSLVLQIQGNGPISLLVVECTHEMTMRATAKWDDVLPAGGFRELVGSGLCVITLVPKDGSPSYQGVVPMEGDQVADIISSYMLRSEQLETSLWLAVNETCAAGMLLQKLPDQPLQNTDDWNRALHLAETLKPQELLTLDINTLLTRLFNEDDIRLFDPQPVSFYCSCSKVGVAGVLRMLGKDEITNLLGERGMIEVHCEFCNQRYEFDPIDAEQIFVDEISIPGTDTRH
jgi:molecular chaperone Hsp33